MTAATASWAEEEDDWELINDDGFVYKRKKRARLDPTASTSASPPEPAAKENCRKRKKKRLIKLKERYQNEIHQWELLSNTLEELNIKSQNQRQPHQLEINQLPVDSPAQSSDSTCGALLDDLLAQAEAQEL